MALQLDDLLAIYRASDDTNRKTTVNDLLALNTSANDGQINIDGGDGITASGDNATANQAGNTTRTLSIDETWLSTWLPANYPHTVPGDGNINISGGDGITATGQNAKANQTGDTTRTLAVDEAWLGTWLTANYPHPAPPTVGDGNININGGDGITATGQNAKANQSGNTTRTLAVDESWLGTWLTTNYPHPTPPTVGNGALTIKTAGENASATGSFTANQGGASTLTLPTIRYGDLSGKPTIPAAANNGQINIAGGSGITATGDNATANQSGNTTRTLAVDNTVIRTTGNQSMAGVKTFTGTIGTNTNTVFQLENLPSLP